MVEWILASSGLILIVIILRHALKGRVNPRLRYALWGIVLLRLLIPVMVFSGPVSVAGMEENIKTGVASFKNAANKTEITEASPAVSDITTVAEDNTVSAEGSVGWADAGYPGSDLQPTAQKGGLYGIALVKGVWLCGVFAVGVALIGSNVLFCLKLRRSRRPIAADGCRLPVYMSKGLFSPCLVGFFRPAIYVTPEAAEDGTRLKHILAHELTHYRHGDQVWAALRGVCLALHWYNPLVWRAAFLSRRDAELACDEGAIRILGEDSRAEYGRTLISLAAAKRSPAGLLNCSTAMTSGKSGLKERVRSIVEKPKTLVIALIIAVAISVPALVIAFSGKSDETPYRLTHDLRAEDIASVSVISNDGTEDLSDISALVGELNALKKADFSRSDADAADAECQVRFESGGKTYILSYSEGSDRVYMALDGDSAKQNGGSWEITAPSLRAYIGGLAENTYEDVAQEPDALSQLYSWSKNLTSAGVNYAYISVCGKTEVFTGDRYRYIIESLSRFEMNDYQRYNITPFDTPDCVITIVSDGSRYALSFSENCRSPIYIAKPSDIYGAGGWWLSDESLCATVEQAYLAVYDKYAYPTDGGVSPYSFTHALKVEDVKEISVSVGSYTTSLPENVCNDLIERLAGLSIYQFETIQAGVGDADCTVKIKYGQYTAYVKYYADDDVTGLEFDAAAAKLYGSGVRRITNEGANGYMSFIYQLIRSQSTGSQPVYTQTESGNDQAKRQSFLEAYAGEYISNQIMELEKDPALKITGYTITGLTRVETGTAALTYDIQMWLLEYRLQPESLNGVALPEGMTTENGCITEQTSGGKPLLVVVRDIAEDSYQRVGMTFTGIVENTYGGDYTQATMTMYSKFKADKA